MRTRTLGGIVGICALAAGTWWAGARPDGPQARDPDAAVVGPPRPPRLATGEAVEDDADLAPDEASVDGDEASTHRAAVAGRVTGSEGRPVAGMQVHAMRRADDAGGLETVGLQAVETREDGSFLLEGLPEGPLVVVAGNLGDPPSRSASTQATAPAAGLSLTLGAHAQGMVVAVRIVGPDGEPVPRARVVPGLGTPGVDADGGRADFYAEDLIRGFEVEDPRDAMGRPLPLAIARVTAAQAVGPEVVVRLRPERAIAGRMVDPEGRGVAGAFVSATTEDGEARAGAPSAADGAFRLGGIEAGEYRLSFNVPPGFLAPEPVTARGGADDVRVTVRRVSYPVLRVVDWRGGPVSDARVGVHPVGADPAAAQRRLRERAMDALRTSADGSVALQVDEAVEHVLLVRGPETRLDVGEVAIDAWRPKDRVIRMPRTYGVRGRVTDSLGKPVFALVRAFRAEGSFDETTHHDGTFEVRDVPATGVRLSVREIRGLHFTEPVHAPAGTEGLRLVVVGQPLVVHVENLPQDARDVRAVIVDADGAQAESRSWDPRDEDGRLSVPGVRLGSVYSLWVAVPGAAPRLAVWQDDVRPDGSELRVALAPVRSTRGTVVLPATVRSAAVEVTRRGVLVDFVFGTREDGSFERALAEGPYVFRAMAEDEAGDVWGGSTEALAGSAVRIVMERKPREAASAESGQR